MKQKVIKVGSSAAVTISKKFLEELGLKIGDEIIVDIDKKGRIFKVKPFVLVDEELFSWTSKFIKQYKPALDALAKK